MIELDWFEMILRINIHVLILKFHENDMEESV